MDKSTAHQFNFLKKKKESFSFSKNDKLFFDNLARLLKEVDSCFNEFNFHKAAEKIYKFFWHNYCDRTIEDTKRRIKEAKRPEDKEAAEYVLYYGLVNMLKILHPFVPYVSESIYQMLPKRDKKALIIENWPREKDFKL